MKDKTKESHLGSGYCSPGNKWWWPELRCYSENKVRRTDSRHVEGRMDKNWLLDVKEESREVKQWLPSYWLGNQASESFQNRLLGLTGGDHGQRCRVGKGRGHGHHGPCLLVCKPLASVYRMAMAKTLKIYHFELWTSFVLCTILPPVGMELMECKKPLIIGLDEL